MTSMTIDFATTGRGSARNAVAALIDAAKRGDVQVRRERRWDVYLINGAVRPEARTVLVKLIADGVLVVADPDADLSLITPKEL